MTKSILKKNPEVLIHSNYCPSNHGGIEVVVRQLIDILEGLDVNVRCFFGGEESFKKNISTNTTFISRKIFAKFSGAPVLSWGNSTFVLEAMRAKLIIFQEPFPFLWPSVFVLNRVLKIPVIVLVHANPASRIKVMRLYSWIRSIVFCGSICVTTSPNLGEKVFSSSFKKNLVIPLCMPDVACALRPVLTLPSRFALYIGRLAAYKGLEYLLDAAKMCPEVTILVVGDGPLSRTIADTILAQSINNVLYINRFVTDSEKCELIERCDFVVFPSTSENEAFGLVQLEAMRASKPIVNTLLDSGVNFVAPNDVCALTVEKCNSQELAFAIKLLWADDILRLELGRNGKERFLEKFSDKVFIKKWIELLEVCIRID